MKPERSKYSIHPGIWFVITALALGSVLQCITLNATERISDHLNIQVSFPEFGRYEIAAEGEYQVIRNDEMRLHIVPGKPLLPLMKQTIALPPGAIVRSVNVDRTGAMELPGTFRIKPASQILSLADGMTDANEKMQAEWQKNYDATYLSDTAYPGFQGKIAGAGTLRKYAYVAVSVSPFTYHPLSGRLISYRAAEITVHYDLPSAGSVEARQVEASKRDRVADDLAARLFENFDQVREMYVSESIQGGSDSDTYDYVILTQESLVGSITASSFYQWKVDTGNNILVVLNNDPQIESQPGDDLAERIRTFLRENYMTWGMEHLLIVGDYETIPMRYCYPDPNDHNFNVWDPYTYPGEIPTDYYYADLSLPDEDSWDSDGDGYYGEYGQDSPDFMADIFVGRIPTSEPSRILYTLNKVTSFGQDTGSWKNRALQPGTILFYENQDYGGYPFCDGARLMDKIESDGLMDGWEVSHYSEQDGLRTSDWDWPPVSEAGFTSDWRNGQYSVVNWSAHGGPQGTARTVWQWDDGDGVPESHEFWSPWLINVWSNLDDDFPSIVFAVSCLVGYPEPNPYGNLGIDLLTEQNFGAGSAVLSSSRPAAISGNWPSDPGGAESLCYEFNRFMLDGPNGSEMLGNALYESKFFSHQNYGWDHIYEYMNLYNYNLYGDPAMLREGASTPIVDDADAGFMTLSGSWLTANNPNAHGGSCVYNPAGTGENRAAWRVDGMIAPGKYDVFVWKFDHAYSHLMASDAHYMVRDRDHTSEWIVVDQSTEGDAWIRLGSFAFDDSRAQGILITDEANGYVVADAVKLVYTGTLP